MDIHELETGDLIQDDEENSDWGIFLGWKTDGENDPGEYNAWAIWFYDRDLSIIWQEDAYKAVCATNEIKEWLPYDKLNKLEQLKIINALNKYKGAIDKNMEKHNISMNMPK